MCGITGIFWPDVERPDLEEPLLRMQHALRHRGPDDKGRFIASNRMIGLANTRLSILDLSPAGHQPMEDPGTGNTITYNGEVYNYQELREELSAGRKQQGVRSGEPCKEVEGQTSEVSDRLWQSNSDTEVILRAYARWGRECLHHLRGMFAFAIYDAGQRSGDRAGRLFLARDPFGIKPLYYYQTDRLFLFASEVGALLASGLVPRKLSVDGLASYLQFGSVQDPWTIIDGVQALLPGHSLIVESKNDRLQVECSNYTKELFRSTASTGSTRRQAVESLRATLEESVRLHLVSDVPLGVFLSGGIDSSALVALMSRVAHERPKTFSVVFTESEFSEAAHARLIAKRFGTEHREILLSEESLLGLLPGALEAMDQPTMDGINTFIISKAVKEAGVTVALSGLGGDELFAGYPSFRRAEKLQRVALLPHALRRSASSLGRALLNGTARRRKFWDLIESDCSPHAAYAISRQLFGPNEVAALMTDFRSLTPGVCFSLPSADPINDVALYELRGYMANTLLRDTDQMSMAHALEVRVPFLDPVVVKNVLGLPGKWKMDGRCPKPLLLDVLGNLIPEEVWRRRKMGFTLPFQQWMRLGLEGELDGVFSSAEDFSLLGINFDYARAVWQAFKRTPQREPSSRSWSLYVLQRWCDFNNVRL